MKKWLSIILAFQFTVAYADTLTLFTVMERAVEKSAIYELENNYDELIRLQNALAATYNYPMLFLAGQYTYQSEVFEFPSNPLFEGPDIPKAQGKVALEVNQIIYNGGKARNEALIQQEEALAEKARLQIDFEGIRKGVGNLYYGIMVLRKRVELLEISLVEYERQRRTVSSLVENGVVLPGDLNRFDLLILRQRSEILHATSEMSKLENLLSDWTGMEISSQVLASVDYTWPESVNKPADLSFLDHMTKVIDTRIQTTNSDRMPQISAFLQAGFGQPNPVNFFDDEWSSFYIGGIRARWEIFDFNRSNLKTSLLETKKLEMNTRKNFLVENKTRELDAKRKEFVQNEDQLELDEQAVELQGSIVSQSKRQYEEGVLTASEYLEELNKQNTFKLMVEIRIIQMNKILFEANQIAGIK